MDEKMEKEAINPNNNKSNTFNLVIGIATLLIAILGATFAYFSATARSAENDVTVKSAYVSISYDGGTEIKATNLIPSTLTVALDKYQKPVEVYDPETDEPIITDYDAYKADEVYKSRRCVDAKGKEVCYVYQFSVSSDGTVGGTTDILASIQVNKNEFENLSYILYEVTFQKDNGVALTDRFGFGVVERYEMIQSSFANVDDNDDNVDFKDVKFGKFEQPEDIFGESGELTGTLKPVACLFGYADNAAEKSIDDTSRCAPYSITNNVEHVYQLVIWLEETGDVQDEQGLAMEGTVAIEVSGGLETSDYEDGKITGQK